MLCTLWFCYISLIHTWVHKHLVTKESISLPDLTCLYHFIRFFVVFISITNFIVICLIIIIVIIMLLTIMIVIKITIVPGSYPCLKKIHKINQWTMHIHMHFQHQWFKLDPTFVHLCIMSQPDVVEYNTIFKEIILVQGVYFDLPKLLLIRALKITLQRM